MSEQLRRHGYSAGEARDATSDDPTTTVIEYGAGAERDAEDISGLLGDIPTEPDSELDSGHIHVVLADDYTPQSADELAVTSTSPHPGSVSEGDTTTTTTTTSSTTTTTTSPTPDQGKPLSGAEIPCVN
jgi:hypothetical protein